MFDPRRFLRLAHAQWAEQWRTYAWFIAICVLLHFVLCLIMLVGKDGYMAFSTTRQGGLFYAGLFLTAPIFSARYFQSLSERGPALLVLMRPATAFEKWLLAFVVVALLYPLVYSLAFEICNFPAHLIAKAQAAQRLQELMQQVTPGEDEQNWMKEALTPENYQLYLPFSNDEDWRVLVTVFLSLGLLQAFAMLGSLYFRRMPFIKTLVTGFLVLLATIFVSEVTSADSTLFMGYWGGDAELSRWQGIFYPAAWLLVPSLLWLASFFALQERELR